MGSRSTFGSAAVRGPRETCIGDGRPLRSRFTSSRRTGGRVKPFYKRQALIGSDHGSLAQILGTAEWQRMSAETGAGRRGGRPILGGPDPHDDSSEDEVDLFLLGSSQSPA